MFQTVSGQGCLGLVEKAFALSLSEGSLTLPQAHFTDGARSSGQHHNLLWVSAMGSWPTLPHRLTKDWESTGSCRSPPKPPLTSHRIPNHDRNNMEEGDVTESICCMLSTVPSCFMYLICEAVLEVHTVPFSGGKLRHREVVSLCVGNSPCDFSNMFPVGGHRTSLGACFMVICS